MDKINILKKYIQEISKLDIPSQRSEEWYRLRKSTIGGSEIATVINKNIYQNKSQLMYKKLKLNDNKNKPNNINVTWGVTMENISNKFIEQFIAVDNKLIEFGSIPGPIEGQRYSPDGVAVISNNKNENYIVLFEIKSPITRKTKLVVPPYYMPQIKTGLCTIYICDYGLFFDSNYKLCTLSQLDNDYEYKFPNNKIKPNNTFICCGIVNMFINIKPNDKKDIEYLEYLSKNKFDVIENEYDNMEKILNYIYEGYIKIKCTPIYIKNINHMNYNKKNVTINLLNNVNLKSIKKLTENNELGYFCWKMFNCTIKKVLKDTNYLNKHKNKIVNFIKELNDFNNIENEKEKKNKFINKYKYSHLDTEEIIKNEEYNLHKFIFG